VEADSEVGCSRTSAGKRNCGYPCHLCIRIGHEGGPGLVARRYQTHTAMSLDHIEQPDETLAWNCVDAADAHRIQNLCDELSD
jgi:hypothetical protein